MRNIYLLFCREYVRIFCCIGLFSSLTFAISSYAASNVTCTPQVSSGEQCCLSLKANGTVWAWGYNGYGQLGDGTTSDRSIPKQIKGLDNIVAIAGGGYHNLALQSDGTVWAWGGNSNGQLGDGTLTDRYTPVSIPGLDKVIAVADGGWHSLALKSDGTVWAWGDNGYGQLGNGTTSSSSDPLKVPGLERVIAIAGGGEHSLALKSDGTIWAWGQNYSGQLGNGNNDLKSAVPMQVKGLNDVVGIAAGSGHSLALKSDGTVWTWGANGFGQLGDGSTEKKHVPVQVPDMCNIVSIAGGGGHSLALQSDGTSWAWGNDEYGQLGNGTKTYRSTVPVRVRKLSGVISIDCGWRHSIALKSDGTVWGWGLNWHGELGDGTITDHVVPYKSKLLSQAQL